MSDLASLKYRAFLSYAHADSGWAQWLHKALEGFRVDKDLAGRDTPLGPVPKTLRPIFRDREDFSGGHSLTEATLAAIDASAALIVICSPTAATRPMVNEEVRLFRSRHSERPVIPVIVDGAWPDNAPPALRYELAADGAITDRPLVLLGPDLRESGDGKRLGLAKTVAGLTGIFVDDIFRRAERAAKRHAHIRNSIIAVLAFFAIAAGGSALYAWHQLKTNEAFLNATLKRATEIVDEAVTQATRYNVPRTATLALLGKAEGLFDDMAQYGQPTPELRYRKAWMLIQFARNYAILGDTTRRHDRVNEAYRLLAQLTAEKPGDTSYQFQLAIALIEVGDVLLAQGNLPVGLASFRTSLATFERLAKADSTNPGRQRGMLTAYERIGEVLRLQGNLPEALTSFRAGLTIASELAKEADKAAPQHDLSVINGRIGEVLFAQNDFAGAFEAFRESHRIIGRLADTHPNNLQWQRDLAAAEDQIGDILFVDRNFSEALASYRRALAIRERVAKADPKNMKWLHDNSVSHEKIGRVLQAQGNLPEALMSFRADLAISEQLAKADPDDATLQRGLSVSYRDVGGVLVAQGNLAEALRLFRASLAIRAKLAAKDRSNARWQDDLRVSSEDLGSLAYRFVLAGDFASGLETADNAISFAPEQIWIHGNRAHALMLLDRVDEARTIYLQYRGAQKVSGEKSWAALTLEDFAEMRKARLTHPLMDEIEKQFVQQ